MSVLVADGHNDLLLELVHRRAELDPFGRHWAAKLRSGGSWLTICGVSVTNDGRPVHDYPRRVLEFVAAFDRAIRDAAGSARRVLSANDLDELGATSELALLLDLEGLEPLGDQPELVFAYHALGFRSFGLTWNHANAFATGVGASLDEGLTDRGRAVLSYLETLPAVVDLSHASRRTVAGTLDHVSPGKAFVSHACCSAVYEHPRNLADDQLRTLRDHGGILGLLIHPLTVDPDRPTVDRLVDHIDHAVAIMGVENVAIGADFQKQVSEALDRQEMPAALLPPGMRVGDTIEGIDGPEHFPVLVETLERRGYDRASIDAIAGGNLLRFLRAAL